MLAAFLLALPIFVAPQKPATVAPAADPRAALTTALDGVYAKMRARDWKAVQKNLGAVLAEFEGSDVARGKLLEIEELARLSAFWSSHKDPDPKLLISGEVELLARNSDLVRIAYEKGRTYERNAKRPKFRPISVPAFGTGKPSKTRSPFPDFEQLGELTVHPLQFNGPYTAEVRGSIPMDGGIAPSIVLVLDTDEIYVATFADTITFERISNGGETRTEVPIEKSSGVAAGEEFKIDVSVTETSVTFRTKGRIVIQSPKPKGIYGWFGFLGGRRISFVKFSGKTYGQWIDALVDAAVAEDREKFDRQYDPRKVLPAWLYDVADKAVRDEAAEKKAIENVQHGFAADVVKQWGESTKAGKWTEALALVDTTDDQKVKPLTRAWAKASVLFRLERLEEARAAASLVAAQEPKHFEMRMLEAMLGLRIDRTDAGVETARGFVRDFPASLEARRILVAMLIHRGRHADALHEAERGFAAGVDRAEMEKLVKQCRRAVAGPTWRATTQVATDHYAMASDLDRATLAQLGKVLEETHAFLAQAIGPIATDNPPMRVFVFSGKQAYFDYCEDLVGDSMNRTQGMFSPELSQLLFWNAVDRAEFVQTARHEAVHQYLHALVAEVPVWLHEGLAQYFETIRKEKGKWVAGGVLTDARDLLRELPDKQWPKLDQFIALERDGFYGQNAQLTYAISWMVIHTLAQGTPEDRALFDGLLGRLARGVDGAVAVRETFEGVDFTALLARVKAHAAAM